jgi:predicted anti-sigma-YlaC factor YlaD
VTTDEFAHFDGAYVLGALSTADRIAFERHLTTCPECRAQVDELAGLPALLALAPESAFAPEPALDDDPVLPLLARERTRRTHRRWLAAAVATVAAACLVLVTAVVVEPHSAKTSANSVAMAAVVPAPIHATAQVTDVAWGARIQLRCTYDESGVYTPATYTLIVQSRDGTSDMIGTWNVVPGRVTTFTAGTAVQLADIKTITIGTLTGAPVLQLHY